MFLNNCKNLFLFFLLHMAFNQVHAQLGQNKESFASYKHEWSFGPLVHTNGFGGNLQFASESKNGNFQLVDISFYTCSHPKEIDQPNPDNQQSHSYVFGKLNSFFCLNAGYGGKIVLAEKWVSNGVRISMNFTGGPVLGILKPVYYEIQSKDQNGSSTFEKFRPDDDDQHARTIGTDFWRGFKETGAIYGIHGKGSLSFDWGSGETHYFSLEAGCTVDAFPIEVPIFAYIKNQRVFANLFLAFTFGKRY